MTKVEELRTAAIKGEDRYKGIYTAFNNYIKSNNLKEVPLDLYHVMQHFEVTNKNILGYKIDARIPFYVGFSGRSEIIQVIKLAVELEVDVKRHGKIKVLIDTHRLNHS